jgi:hypothetical protein
VDNPPPHLLYQTRLPLSGAANPAMTVQHVINLESILSKYPRLLQQPTSIGELFTSEYQIEVKMSCGGFTCCSQTPRVTFKVPMDLRLVDLQYARL